MDIAVDDVLVHINRDNLFLMGKAVKASLLHFCCKTYDETDKIAARN